MPTLACDTLPTLIRAARAAGANAGEAPLVADRLVAALIASARSRS
jgi:hypothetical protein